jgi:hypothetical protein
LKEYIKKDLTVLIGTQIHVHKDLNTGGGIVHPLPENVVTAEASTAPRCSHEYPKEWKLSVTIDFLESHAEDLVNIDAPLPMEQRW